MPQTSREVLGQVLVTAREALNRSPEQVGALVGISGRTIRRLEDGEAGHPRRTTLEALAGIYGLNPDFIIELAELELADDRLLVLLRDRARLALGPQVVQALEGVEREAVALAMRLARASTPAEEHLPQRGKRQFLISFLRGSRTTSRREQTEAIDAFSDFLTLDRPRRELARQLLRDLRLAQDAERSENIRATADESRSVGPGPLGSTQEGLSAPPAEKQAQP